MGCSGMGVSSTSRAFVSSSSFGFHVYVEGRLAPAEGLDSLASDDVASASVHLCCAGSSGSPLLPLPPQRWGSGSVSLLPSPRRFGSVSTVQLELPFYVPGDISGLDNDSVFVPTMILLGFVPGFSEKAPRGAFLA